MAQQPDIDIVEEIRERTGPIEDHLEMLATSSELPAYALGVCTIRFDESCPVLLALLERAAAGEPLDDDEAQLLFCGVHILGGRRETDASAPLLRLLRRPRDEVERLVGAAVTETMPKILAGVFDGDAEALFAAIADTSLDEYVRDAIFRAATFLTWDGRIPLERMRAFLERFHRERLAEDDDYAWVGWQNAIALLGLADLRPLVHLAWAEGRLDEELAESEYFEADFAAAQRSPDDAARFSEAHLGYVEDILVELERFTWGDDEVGAWSDDDFAAELLGEEYLPDADQAGERLEDVEWTEPAINSRRDVGRNDPCPCGSGRKFKKCCLGAEGES